MLYDFAPPQKWRFARLLIPKRAQPYLRGLRKRVERMGAEPLEHPFAAVYPYTQAHPARQRNLVALAQRVDADRVPGAIVECGVLDGGTAALMAWASNGRDVHLFDAWEGLPETTSEDGEELKPSRAGQVVGSPRRVAAVMNALSVEPGLVSTTIEGGSTTRFRRLMSDLSLLFTSIATSTSPRRPVSPNGSHSCRPAALFSLMITTLSAVAGARLMSFWTNVQNSA